MSNRCRPVNFKKISNLIFGGSLTFELNFVSEAVFLASTSIGSSWRYVSQLRIPSSGALDDGNDENKGLHSWHSFVVKAEAKAFSIDELNKWFFHFKKDTVLENYWFPSKLTSFFRTWITKLTDEINELRN